MSYELRIDEMVGKHVAEFQDELTLAARIARIEKVPAMPYGYPTRLYHPHHIVFRPIQTKYESHEHGRLSNDVPWVLGMEVVDSYAVGLYNPRKEK